MNSNLFAFNVSKEVVDIPSVSSVYDPDKQVTVWVGDDTIQAGLYCTHMPYNNTHCVWGTRNGSLWCGNYLGWGNSYDSACDVS
jgi:hypothetical protein